MMTHGSTAEPGTTRVGAVRRIAQATAHPAAPAGAKRGAQAAPGGRWSALAPSPDILAFDPGEFDELIEMLGEEGVVEMLEIFETETRRRLLRLTAGDQDIATQMREMHTLKGAAGTVAAPRLAALGRSFEQAARKGIAPGPDDLKAIEDGLEAFLVAVRTWYWARAGV
jgi:HPt (histidine-containing phosphotransfer) domain-containing protein